MIPLGLGILGFVLSYIKASRLSKKSTKQSYAEERMKVLDAVFNINNDGKTLVTVSDGEDGATKDKVFRTGEAAYCSCSSSN